MSKKDYIVIAAALERQRRTLAFDFYVPDSAAREPLLRVIDKCARAIADVCANDNPEFDRARFLTACGVA